MGKLSIHCNGCGSDWVVYHRDNWKNWRSRTCPVCGKSVDPGTWERFVLPAFGSLEDANIELYKDHNQGHGTLFTVSYIPEVLFPDAGEDMREEIENLKGSVETLSGVMRKLIDSLFAEEVEGG